MWPLVTSVGSQLLSVIVAQNGELVSGEFHGEAFHQEGESAGERIGAATSGHLPRDHRHHPPDRRQRMKSR